MITDATLAQTLKPHRDPARSIQVWLFGLFTVIQVLILLGLFVTHADARSLAMAVFGTCIMAVTSAVTMLRHYYLTPLYRALKGEGAE